MRTKWNKMYSFSRLLSWFHQNSKWQKYINSYNKNVMRTEDGAKWINCRGTVTEWRLYKSRKGNNVKKAPHSSTHWTRTTNIILCWQITSMVAASFNCSVSDIQNAQGEREYVCWSLENLLQQLFASGFCYFRQ